jgi:hypothetical protein
MTYWCLVGNGWEWITGDYGSFPHSLLSTSKMMKIDEAVFEIEMIKTDLQ